MGISRIYQPVNLETGASIQLNEQSSHHLARVLRAQINDLLTVFNGQGGEYLAKITDITKKGLVRVEILQFSPREAESPLDLCLAQGISRGEKMDYTIQKAVELGVKHIIPLFTERCTVKLDNERLRKRLEHWEAIIISACEQSGRNRIPKITMPDSLDKMLPQMKADFCFVLAPTATQKLSQLSMLKNNTVILLIGPEGGLSETEIKLAMQYHFLPLNLGPRILRTETAAVAAMTALQCYFGDMR